jgi:5'-nucleotidase
MTAPRILVTNDDGIDSVGLHRLAQALTDLGQVMVVAPDREFSGAGAAIGAVHLEKPEAARAQVEGIDDAYAVSGAPALCVLLARLGAFGPRPDLIVSGINPGANVGRSVYHSGTIGACLTGRNGGITGLAVSQGVSSWDIQGQGWTDLLANQKWDSAAMVAKEVARALLASPPEKASVLNLNVPNLELDELTAWRWADIYGSLDEHESEHDRGFGSVSLKPKDGESDRFDVEFDWGQGVRDMPNTDVKAMADNEVALSWIGRLGTLSVDAPLVDGALNKLIS